MLSEGVMDGVVMRLHSFWNSFCSIGVELRMPALAAERFSIEAAVYRVPEKRVPIPYLPL